VARSVKKDHAVARRSELEQPAQAKLRHHAADAVEHHQGRAFAALVVVHPHAIDFDESADRRIDALGLPSALMHPCCGRQRGGRRQS
jgi:hypothetical protein